MKADPWTRNLVGLAIELKQTKSQLLGNLESVEELNQMLAEFQIRHDEHEAAMKKARKGK